GELPQGEAADGNRALARIERSRLPGDWIKGRIGGVAVGHVLLCRACRIQERNETVGRHTTIGKSAVGAGAPREESAKHDHLNVANVLGAIGIVVRAWEVLYVATVVAR